MDYAPALALTAAFAVMLSVLGLVVSLRRGAKRADFGDAGDEVLRRRIRAHGNFSEYAPLGVLTVWALAASGAAPGWVWTAAAVLLASRLLHAAGMLFARTPTLRAVAMVLQHTTLVLAAFLILLRLL